MDEELWLEKMRWRLQRKFENSNPGKIRSTKLRPSDDTTIADRKAALMERRRQGVFRTREDGTLSFLAKTPEGGAVEILVDPIDLDLADDDIWRVIYSNGSPYIVSRFFIPEFGAAKLCTIIAQRKYGKHAPIGRITHENGVSMDCTRANLLSAPDRRNIKSWERLIREWLRKRRQDRKVTMEMEKAFKVAKRRKENVAKIHSNNFKPRKYSPTHEETLFDSWIGAYERSPGRWRVVLKSLQNTESWEAEQAHITHPTESDALKRALDMWLPYTNKSVEAEAIAYATAKITACAETPTLKDATKNLLGDFKNDDDS